MILRRPASLLLSLLALPIALATSGCGSLQTIAIIPAAGSVNLTVLGQTAQFTAIGTNRMGSAAPTTSNITTSATWSVSNPSVATINSAGIATAVGAGHALVTAESDGKIATSDITVTLSSSGGGTTPGSPNITITPGSTTSTFTGETTQFLASGTLTGGVSQDLTNQVQWISSNVQVATITAGGLATAVSSGTTTITARSGGLSSTSTLTVTLGPTTPATPTLSIIPGSVTATGIGAQTQFIAIGNLSGNGPVLDLSKTVTWISSAVGVASITSSGLATTLVNPAAGTTYSTTITAIGTTTTGSVITSTVLMTVMPPGTPSLPTLSIFETGSGSGTVITTSGTAPFINCGSSAGAVCAQTFPVGTVVTLTETPATGSTFAGWTSNCAVATAKSCTITVTSNQSVGATFN